MTHDPLSLPSGEEAQSPLWFFEGACPGGLGSEGGLTSESESDELELEELEESLELSEAIPVDSCRSTESARTANSGCSCFKILSDETRALSAATATHRAPDSGLSPASARRAGTVLRTDTDPQAGHRAPAAQASLKGKLAARDWLLPSELTSHARCPHGAARP